MTKTATFLLAALSVWGCWARDTEPPPGGAGGSMVCPPPLRPADPAGGPPRCCSDEDCAGNTTSPDTVCAPCISERTADMPYRVDCHDYDPVCSSEPGASCAEVRLCWPRRDPLLDAGIGDGGAGVCLSCAEGGVDG